MKMQWWQLGFMAAAGWLVYRVFFYRPSAPQNIDIPPAVEAGATQGGTSVDVASEPANASANPGQITGVINPAPDLGYNFSPKKNNTFSPPGNSQSPTFLAYGSDADMVLSPIYQTYLENINGGWIN